jgi:hypothetical protein
LVVGLNTGLNEMGQTGSFAIIDHLCWKFVVNMIKIFFFAVRCKWGDNILNVSDGGV